MEQLVCVLSGLIFLSGDEGLDLTQIQSSMPEFSKQEIDSGLKQIMDEYAKDIHGFELVDYGGIYKFISKAHIHPYAQTLFASVKTNSLSNAALETLAIIAYKQPITRVEIEEIRGVGCDMMIRKLLARGLIQECGRSDAIGRPILYEVTTLFMDEFKLTSLKELPELPQFDLENKEELFDQ